MDHLREATLSKETVFSGKLVALELQTVRLPNGREAKREIVRHPGAVAILARTASGKVLLLRQYRKALDRTLLEIPAGKLEPGEQPERAARRELLEETGYEAIALERIASLATSPGFADEVIHVYFADGLTAPGEQQLDGDEFVDLLEVEEREALAIAEAEPLADVKTAFALQWLRARSLLREQIPIENNY